MSLNDYTRRDYDALRQALIERAQQQFPDWTDQGPMDMGMLLLELFAYMGDQLFYHQDRIAAESYLATAQEPGHVQQLLRLVGCEPRPALPASAEIALLFSPSASGAMVLPKGQAFRTGSRHRGATQQFLYQGPELSVSLGALPVLQKEELPGCPVGPGPFRVLRVPVLQVDRRVTGERLGWSDGGPLQRFQMESARVQPETVSVRVAGEPWRARADLLDSSGQDQHYRLRADADGRLWVEFGAGKNGACPPVGLIEADYQVGAGTAGNVVAGTLTEWVGGRPAGLLGLYNPAAATGGAEAETPDEAALRGPARFRARDRAVTAADYEGLARAFGLAKVRVRAGAWNRVELTGVPEGGGRLTPTLRADLQDYLDARRMLGTELRILDAVEVGIEISALVYHDPRVQRLSLEAAVRASIDALFALEQVELGQTLYLSRLYEALEALPGLHAVVVQRYSRPGGEALPADGKIALAATELPCLGSLKLVFQEADRVRAS